MEAVVGKLSDDLHRDLIKWEAKMDDKVKAQLLNHQSEFEKNGRVRSRSWSPAREMASFRTLNFAFEKCRRGSGLELEGSDGEGG